MINGAFACKLLIHHGSYNKKFKSTRRFKIKKNLKKLQQKQQYLTLNYETIQKKFQKMQKYFQE